MGQSHPEVVCKRGVCKAQNEAVPYLMVLATRVASLPKV